MKCPACQHDITGHYCSNCGQPAELHRINWSYIRSEIGSVFFLEKGFFYSVKELLFRPAESIKRFLLKDRKRLIKPVIFILLTSLIYSLLTTYFFPQDFYVDYDGGPDSAMIKILDWVTQNYGYSNILMAGFIAVWLKVFFRKQDYNFFEILILLCFVMGISMLLFSVMGLLSIWLGTQAVTIGTILIFLYLTWAMGQFYGGRLRDYLKAGAAYLLGMLIFFLVAVFIGLFIDIIFK